MQDRTSICSLSCLPSQMIECVISANPETISSEASGGSLLRPVVTPRAPLRPSIQTNHSETSKAARHGGLCQTGHIVEIEVWEHLRGYSNWTPTKATVECQLSRESISGATPLNSQSHGSPYARSLGSTRIGFRIQRSFRLSRNHRFINSAMATQLKFELALRMRIS